MRKGYIPLVVGNWKMNPQSRDAAKRLAQDIKKGAARLGSVRLVLAPPALFMPDVYNVQNGSKVFELSAQNVHWEKLGAHTGEVSIPMFSEYKVSFGIVGHSERRAVGETDEDINKKVLALIKAHVHPIVCVGEKKRDQSGSFYTFVEKQLKYACACIPKSKMGQIVIAYEPVWAIGTGNTATPENAYEMKLFIQKVLADLYGRSIASKIAILYGGSVNPKNAEALFAEGNVDGFLVGGASLRADTFVTIAKIANQYAA